MKYEITNPSDPYTIESDDPTLAIICCLLLGEGRYGLKDGQGNTTMPIMLLASESQVKEWMKTHVNVDLNSTDYMENNSARMADCLATVKLNSEKRLSLNDIGARAKELEKSLRWYSAGRRML